MLKCKAMKKIFISLLFALSLAGCGSQGVMVSEEKTQEFKEGVTTEQEIRQKLGPPSTVESSKKGKVLIYEGGKLKYKAETFIPVVGIFAGGADTKSSKVIFQIGTDGKLKSINRSESTSEFRNFD